MDTRTGDSLLGIPIGCDSVESAGSQGLAAIDGEREQLVFACANANALWVAQKDTTFHDALMDADLVVADGSSITFMAALARKDVGARIIGDQFFNETMRLLQARGSGRVFFFGASERTLELIAARFATQFPDLTLAGTISPPFREWSDEENRQFLLEINAAKPDVLWVGMTAPKQEKWVFENRTDLDAPLIGAIGAVFDFFAGTVQKAPDWVRKAGLEAFYRLAREPRRLWRRVLVSCFGFIPLVFWREVLGIGRTRD